MPLQDPSSIVMQGHREAEVLSMPEERVTLSELLKTEVEEQESEESVPPSGPISPSPSTLVTAFERQFGLFRPDLDRRRWQLILPRFQPAARNARLEEVEEAIELVQVRQDHLLISNLRGGDDWRKEVDGAQHSLRSDQSSLDFQPLEEAEEGDLGSVYVGPRVDDADFGEGYYEEQYEREGYEPEANQREAYGQRPDERRPHEQGYEHLGKETSFVERPLSPSPPVDDHSESPGRRRPRITSTRLIIIALILVWTVGLTLAIVFALKQR